MKAACAEYMPIFEVHDCKIKPGKTPSQTHRMACFADRFIQAPLAKKLAREQTRRMSGASAALDLFFLTGACLTPHAVGHVAEGELRGESLT